MNGFFTGFLRYFQLWFLNNMIMNMRFQHTQLASVSKVALPGHHLQFAITAITSQLTLRSQSYLGSGR